MDYKILGTTMPVLEVTLNPGESVVSVSGELSWMSSAIEMQTHSQFGGGGGVFGALKRATGGASFFMTEYAARRGSGYVAFATKVPGAIMPLQVHPGQTYMVHRHGFLAGTPGAELSVGFQQSLGAGIFGGEGFRLTRLAGQCLAWIELSGELVTYDLRPGETLRVHPGHVGMFEDRVSFEIMRIKGIRNMLFGGDGIFLAALTGPGRVWLQSLPLPNLAHALSPYLASGEVRAAGAGAVLGSVLKGLAD
ncbi:MAG: TIGR00266 family protein [Chloroflexi bacterium]|nr:TIGR00266 family protein [Chloroflexota bacterium]